MARDNIQLFVHLFHLNIVGDTAEKELFISRELERNLWIYHERHFQNVLAIGRLIVKDPRYVLETFLWYQTSEILKPNTPLTLPMEGLAAVVL